MISFKNRFLNYLSESPAPVEAPPKPDTKPDTEKPSTEPKSPPRRSPLAPRPGFRPRPKATLIKGQEEGEESKQKPKSQDVNLFFKYRQHLRRK